MKLNLKSYLHFNLGTLSDKSDFEIIIKYLTQNNI